MAGENDDFEKFFKKFQNTVFRIVLGYVRQRETAEDITIEGFLHVFKSWERVSRMGNPAGYIVRTGINLAKSHLKSESRMQKVDINEKQIGTNHYSPERRFFLDAANAALERELLRLKDKERNMILLKELDRYTLQEIAEIMGMKLPTAKSIYRRAKIKLAKNLGGDK
jgi:RNA polymerase sigma-70 factor, ECF subfamily